MKELVLVPLSQPLPAGAGRGNRELSGRKSSGVHGVAALPFGCRHSDSCDSWTTSSGLRGEIQPQLESCDYAINGMQELAGKRTRRRRVPTFRPTDAPPSVLPRAQIGSVQPDALRALGVLGGDTIQNTFHHRAFIAPKNAIRRKKNFRLFVVVGGGVNMG